jgi:hypothetical protein
MSRVDAARFGAMKAILLLKGCIAADKLGMAMVFTGMRHFRH